MAFLVLRKPTSGTPTQLWSDPTSWVSGTVPVENEDVVIPAGQTVILDVVTPALRNLDIDGTLIVESGAGVRGITARQIHQMGNFLVGTSVAPFTGTLTIEINGPNTLPNDAHYRGWMIHGTARTEFYGNPTTTPWTKLNAHITAGQTTATLKDSVDWKSGDEIVIGPTDWYNLQTVETRTLAANASGTSITVGSAFGFNKWGQLQYLLGTAPSYTLSLTPGSFTPPPGSVGDFPSQIDERGIVSNLTRNIRIQGPNDSEWIANGFGAHVMVMDRTCTVIFDGVEFFRMGQAGILGRYPLHWHLNSYNTTTGAFLGDIPAGKALVKRCVFRTSKQRGTVIHSTCGVQIEDCVYHDIKGHAIFLEDATERRNTIVRNCGTTIRGALAGKALTQHELEDVSSESGPSFLWITNPDNTITDNYGADCFGAGIWYSFPDQTQGLSQAVVLYPNKIRKGDIQRNWAMGNRGSGVLLRGTVIDRGTGPTTPPAVTNVSIMYGPSYNELPYDANQERDPAIALAFEVPRHFAFKNGMGAYRNRAAFPQYVEWVTAGNWGLHFAGATSDARTDGKIERSLVIKQSLNNANPNRPPPYPYYEGDIIQAAFASYHTSINFRYNVVMGFNAYLQSVSGGREDGGGMVVLSDMYDEPVQQGFYRSVGNVLVNSDWGTRARSPNMMGSPPAVSRVNSLAGAIRMDDGIVGPVGYFWTYDTQYFTYGGPSLAPTNALGGRMCEGPYYGIDEPFTNFDAGPYQAYAHMRVTRFDESWNSVGTWEIYDADIATDVNLQHMRNFAMRKGGRYLLEYPSDSLPTAFIGNVLNAWRADDYVYFGLRMIPPATGTITLCTYPALAAPGSPYRNDPVLVASWAALEASSVSAYWIDTSLNRVWVKMFGGLSYAWASWLPGTDGELNKVYTIRINWTAW